MVCAGDGEEHTTKYHKLPEVPQDGNLLPQALKAQERGGTLVVSEWCTKDQPAVCLSSKVRVWVTYRRVKTRTVGRLDSLGQGPRIRPDNFICCDTEIHFLDTLRVPAF